MVVPLDVLDGNLFIQPLITSEAKETSSLITKYQSSMETPTCALSLETQSLKCNPRHDLIPYSRVIVSTQ